MLGGVTPCVRARPLPRSDLNHHLGFVFQGWGRRQLFEALNAEQALIPGALITAETPAATATFYHSTAESAFLVAADSCWCPAAAAPGDACAGRVLAAICRARPRAAWC